MLVALIAPAVVGFGTPAAPGAAAMRIVFFVMLVCWVIIGLLFIAIMHAVPSRPKLVGATADRLNPEAFDIHQEIQGLGFVAISKPIEVNTNPPAMMLALIDESRKIYSAVYHPTVDESKLGTDFVSVIQVKRAHGEQSILTTGNIAEGGTMPLPPNSMMQIFPDADAATLLRHHEQALAFLQKNGVDILHVTKSEFSPAFCDSLVRMKSFFITNPVWHTLLALVRTVTKRSPHFGPIASQAQIRRRF